MPADAFKYSLKPGIRETLGLTVYNSGYQQCTPNHSWGPAVRDHYLIHLVMSGRGTLHTDGQIIPVSAGEAFITRPSKIVYYVADEENPWEYYWVGFNGTDAGRLISLTEFASANTLKPNKQEKIRQSLLNIFDSVGTSPFKQAQMTGLLYIFLSLLIENAQKPVKREGHGYSYVENALKFIQYNYSSRIDVDEIAHNIGVSRSHLYRMFMQHLSMPPKEFLCRFRINEACALLRNSSLSISEIAYSVGLSDPLYFSRLFKKYKGVPPTKYILSVTEDKNG